jgi:hypothetical protein
MFHRRKNIGFWLLVAGFRQPIARICNSFITILAGAITSNQQPETSKKSFAVSPSSLTFAANKIG